MEIFLKKKDRRFCPKWCRYYYRDCNRQCEEKQSDICEKHKASEKKDA